MRYIVNEENYVAKMENPTTNTKTIAGSCLECSISHSALAYSMGNQRRMTQSLAALTRTETGKKFLPSGFTVVQLWLFQSLRD